MTTPYAVSNDVVSFMAAGTAPAEPELDRLILRACEAIDAYLIGCAYDVDTNGNPTDAVTVAPALKQAVCAQVEYWVVKGDDLDTDRYFQVMGVEGATLNRGSFKAPRIAPRALDILRVAGLKTALFPIHMP